MMIYVERWEHIGYLSVQWESYSLNIFGTLSQCINTLFPWQWTCSLSWHFDCLTMDCVHATSILNEVSFTGKSTGNPWMPWIFPLKMGCPPTFASNQSIDATLGGGAAPKGSEGIRRAPYGRDHHGRANGADLFKAVHLACQSTGSHRKPLV